MHRWVGRLKMDERDLAVWLSRDTRAYLQSPSSEPNTGIAPIATYPPTTQSVNFTKLHTISSERLDLAFSRYCPDAWGSLSRVQYKDYSALFDPPEPTRQGALQTDNSSPPAISLHLFHLTFKAARVHGHPYATEGGSVGLQQES